MNEAWKNTVITLISAAVYVAPNTGRHIHKNRPFHGFVLNDEKTVRDYCFEDGFVMRTKENCLFYLPKGSSYFVKTYGTGGCYAINFEADLIDAPFCTHLRNTESLTHRFKAACDAWKNGDELLTAKAMGAVYEAICQVYKENTRKYVSSAQMVVIRPAVSWIDTHFAERELSIAFLADLCGISQVYFRRLFQSAFGVSPKEYIIQKRLEYAKKLLQSGSFSVGEVAALCGYAEACHFSREFTKQTGISPSRFK